MGTSLETRVYRLGTTKGAKFVLKGILYEPKPDFVTGKLGFQNKKGVFCRIVSCYDQLQECSVIRHIVIAD